MDDCPLTARELQVLGLVADGLEPSEIASRLGVSASTIRTHLSQAIRRTGHVSTLQTVLTAIRRGWVHAPALTPTDELIWRERRDRHLVAIETHLRNIADTPAPPLSREARVYLDTFDRHLAARHWDESELDRTRVRMRELIHQILARKQGRNGG